MSLPMLDFPPPTPHGNEEWTWANVDNHQLIIDGIRRKTGQSLTLYQIYPLNLKDVSGWIEQHARQHDDMNQALGLNGNDLTDVDLNDDRQRTAFYFLHKFEHQAALEALAGFV